MVDVALDLALGLLAAALAIAFFRLLRGPSSVDRLLAIETSSVIVLGIIAIASIRYSRELFVAVLVIAVLGLVSSIAVSKYLVKGRPF